MSWRAREWAKKQEVSTSSEKFVLITIADHYNDLWLRAWPSHARLMQETALSESTVQRVVKRLSDVGMIAIERWYREPDQSRLANRYCLPRFDAASVPASHQPVLAYRRADASVFGFGSAREVPSSDLMIDEDALQ